MPIVKVTHAVFTYKNEDGKRVIARRGDVIEVPQEIFEKSTEAFIPEEAELKSPGTLVPLISEPGDEHVDQYLHSGNTSEIIAQLPGYTKEVLDKLLVAERKGLARPNLLAALGDEDAIIKAEAKRVAQTIPVVDVATEQDIALANAEAEKPKAKK